MVCQDFFVVGVEFGYIEVQCVDVFRIEFISFYLGGIVEFGGLVLIWVVEKVVFGVVCIVVVWSVVCVE